MRKAAGRGVPCVAGCARLSVITGLRRMSNQQMAPLVGLGVDLTNEIVDKHRWIRSGMRRSTEHAERPWRQPASGTRRGQPARIAASCGRKRKPRRRMVTSCTVKTDGGRMVVSVSWRDPRRSPGHCSTRSSRARTSFSRRLSRVHECPVGGLRATTRVSWSQHRQRCTRRVARHCQHMAGYRFGGARTTTRAAESRAASVGGVRELVPLRCSRRRTTSSGARNRHQPWLQLVSQGRRRHVRLLRRASGRTRRRV